MYQVFRQYSFKAIFEGSKSQCRKFLQARVGGRLHKCYGNSWEDARNVSCYCSQTYSEYEVRRAWYKLYIARTSKNN